jgi:hypothetical protein
MTQNRKPFKSPTTPEAYEGVMRKKADALGTGFLGIV